MFVLIQTLFSCRGTGLYKLFNPAIADGRTWCNLGKQGEQGKHGKDGKHQPDDLKHWTYDAKHNPGSAKAGRT